MAMPAKRGTTLASTGPRGAFSGAVLPAGTYVVDGYTYEPWYNLWSPHPGVFKIVDDPDPAASPPAAALTFAEQTVIWGEEASVSGCVDAMDGATMTLSWSNGNINGEPNWQPFAEDMPAQTGSFDVAFVPPIEAASNSVMIKLDIVNECGTCHDKPLPGSPSGLTLYQSYRDSYHGQVTALGLERAARCSDCHGAHDVKRIDDPLSKLSGEGRIET